jgi:hypothetical protein
MRLILVRPVVSVALAAAVVVASAAVATAAPQRASSYCTSGIMSGEGLYRGTIPYFNKNTLTQIKVTITDVNILGFQGHVDAYTYYSSPNSPHIGKDLHLLPTRSVTFTGPTYTTPTKNVTGVPFELYLYADSDAVGLAYKVCV